MSIGKENKMEENTEKKLPIGYTRKKDGRLVGRYYDRAGIRREVVQRKGESLKELEKRRMKLSYEANHGERIKNTGMNVSQLCELWQKNLHGIKKTTARGYDANINNIKKCIGEMKITEVTGGDIDDMCGYYLDDLHYASGTVAGLRQVSYSVFEYARKHNYVTRNPVEDSCVIKDTREEEKALTHEQQELFLEQVKNSHYYELFNILLLTGLRISEAMGLVWEDYSFEKRELRVERNLVQTTTDGKAVGKYTYMVTTPKTENGKRIIPLCDEAVKMFESQLAKRRDDRVIDKKYGDLIFTGRNGSRVSNVNVSNIMRNASKAIKKNGHPNMPSVHPHLLRHTFASNCNEVGMNPKVIAALLGHSRSEFTMKRYVHTDEEFIKSEMQKMKVVGLEGIISDGKEP